MGEKTRGAAGEHWEEEEEGAHGVDRVVCHSETEILIGACVC